MRKATRKHVQTCRTCQLRNTHPRAKPPVQAYSTLSRPFERCHMDLVRPLPKSDKGHTYVLTFVDALTKWVEIFPLHNKSASAVAQRLLDDIICRHGAPSQLISDGGTEFTNAIINELSRLMTIRRINTTPYNPRANGAVERFHRTMETMLYAYCSEHQRDWDTYVPLVAHAYRTTVNETTGYTPFFLMYGRECRMPWEAHMLELSAGMITEWTHQRREQLFEAWRKAAESISQAQSKYNKPNRTPRKWQFTEYHVGQRVFVTRQFSDIYQSVRRRRREERGERAVTYDIVDAQTCEGAPVVADTQQGRQLSRKLAARWAGPYEIVRKFSPVLYEIQMGAKRKVWHATNMKPE
jgi:transposase InsO family protein